MKSTDTTCVGGAQCQLAFYGCESVTATALDQADKGVQEHIVCCDACANRTSFFTFTEHLFTNISACVFCVVQTTFNNQSAGRLYFITALLKFRVKLAIFSDQLVDEFMFVIKTNEGFCFLF